MLTGISSQTSQGDVTNYNSPFYANEETTFPNHGAQNGAALASIGLKAAAPALSIESTVNVYPTITKDLVNIKLPVGLENAIVRVFNSDGKEVTSDMNKTSNRSLNLSPFSSGAYMVHVIVG